MRNTFVYIHIVRIYYLEFMVLEVRHMEKYYKDNNVKRNNIVKDTRRKVHQIRRHSLLAGEIVDTTKFHLKRKIFDNCMYLCISTYGTETATLTDKIIHKLEETQRALKQKRKWLSKYKG